MNSEQPSLRAWSWLERRWDAHRTKVASRSIRSGLIRYGIYAVGGFTVMIVALFFLGALEGAIGFWTVGIFAFVFLISFLMAVYGFVRLLILFAASARHRFSRG